MSGRDDWTPMHHLAYVYAAIASSDGSISNEELEVLCYKLHQWNEEIEIEELVQIAMTAVSALGDDKEDGDTEQLQSSIDLVADALDEDGRAAALGDLLSIAAVDGSLEKGEGDLLLRVREAWEVSEGGERPSLG